MLDRCMFGNPDFRVPAALVDCFATPQQCTFSEVHTCQVIAIAADLALCAPCAVIAARAGEFLVAARAQR
jgi:hypothetical protein